MIEQVCEIDCCGDLTEDSRCDDPAEDACCDEIVSVTRLDCDMVKVANEPLPGPGTTFIPTISTPYVKSAVREELADEWTLRTGPDPTQSRLSIFLI